MSPGEMRPAPAAPEAKPGKPWAAWVLAAVFYAGAIGLAVLYGLHTRPEMQQRRARLGNAVNIYDPAHKQARDEEASYRELTEAIASYESSVNWSKTILVGVVGCFAIARVIVAYARAGRRPAS